MSSPAPPERVSIRRANAADHGALARLCGELGYPTSAENFALRLASLPAGHVVFVAEDSAAAILGFAYAHGTELLLFDRVAELAALVVTANARGNGVGERLVDAVASWARAAGFASLRLRSNVVRVDAHRFYDRLGFTRTKQQVVFDRAL